MPCSLLSEKGAILMREKLASLAEAAATVRDGAFLGLTTSTLDNAPMAFLRELLRHGTKDLRVVTLTGGGLNADLLIGAGVVAEYETCSCSLGSYGPAPNFQRALRVGLIKMKDST
jgi:glutaconate CoA-transferase subunit A